MNEHDDHKTFKQNYYNFFLYKNLLIINLMHKCNISDTGEKEEEEKKN
jgi:hypothetical protein